MGVVLYVLVAGAPPFNAEPGDLLGLYKKVITADFTVPDFVSAGKVPSSPFSVCSMDGINGPKNNVSLPCAFTCLFYR